MTSSTQFALPLGISLAMCSLNDRCEMVVHKVQGLKDQDLYISCCPTASTLSHLLVSSACSTGPMILCCPFQERQTSGCSSSSHFLVPRPLLQFVEAPLWHILDFGLCVVCEYRQCCSSVDHRYNQVATKSESGTQYASL